MTDLATPVAAKPSDADLDMLDAAAFDALMWPFAIAPSGRGPHLAFTVNEPLPSMMTAAEVCTLLRISRATLYRYMRDEGRDAGRFPKPVRYSHKNVRWRATAVQTWLDERDPQIEPTGPIRPAKRQFRPGR